MKNLFNPLNGQKFGLTLFKAIALTLLAFSIGCSGSDNSKRSKNRNVFRIDIRTTQCGFAIQKSFPTQRDLCAFVAYELTRQNCAFFELQREFTANFCHTFQLTGPNGGIIGGPQGGTLPVNIEGPISGPMKDLPEGSAQSDEIFISQGLQVSEQALADYYSVDESGCLARIHNTFDVIDLCVNIRPTGGGSTIEKDQSDTSYTPPRGPEKDDTSTFVAPAVVATPAPQPSVSTPATASPSTSGASVGTPSAGASASPSATTRANLLEYNLVQFNAVRGLRYEELPPNRIPVLRVTGTIDPNSPIFNLRHQNPSDIKAITLKNLNTTCPVRAQLSSSGNTLLMTLLAASDSTDEQIGACRSFFETFNTVSTLDLEFDQPLKMSDGQNMNIPFKFVKQ